MDPLPLPLSIPPGRPRAQREPEYVRDLAEGEGGGPKPAQISAVKRLSQRHHMLARHLATGMAPGEAALLTGYTTANVCFLQRDPAFIELVTFYRAKVDELFFDRQRALAALSTDAILEMHSRLEERPESLSNGQLMELLRTAGDRSGLAPASTQVNIHVGLAERLAAARSRIAPRMVEAPVGGQSDEPT